MKSKGIKIAIVSVSLIAVIVFSLWVTGIIGLWIDGMPYIVNSSDKIYPSGNKIPGAYTISINLGDLESNIGKDLYNDGEYRIYVGWIDNTGNLNTGGYMIGFRSSGNYSLNGATLVSGLQHKVTDQYSYETVFTAEMVAEHNGNVYNSSIHGASGINYKDGDFFSFYIFPTEAYENGEITLDGKGTVDLTITNLFKNTWIRK